MCGIAAYVGQRTALPLVLDGLARLEYRGYDSAGVAVLDTQLTVVKAVGPLDRLREKLPASLPGGTAIGHTRWATHGSPTLENAHPQRSADGRVAIVHNGIIENANGLRAEVQARGITPVSETDSEIAAQLLALALADGPADGGLTEAMRAVSTRLEGTFALVAVDAHRPGELVAVRHGSPLVLGVGDGEMFAASDVAAFIAETRSAVEPDEGDIVTITADGYTITDAAGQSRTGRSFVIDWDIAAAERGGYPTFMDKEIAEQPDAVADTLRGHVGAGRISFDTPLPDGANLADIDKVVILACGSAFHSGLIARYAIESWARVPVEVELASEFRHRDPVLNGRTLAVAISQSGETMDTLQALRHARDGGAKVLAICNTAGAQIPREADAVLYTHAGPEIGVAATKSFLAQVTAGYLLGLALAEARGTFSPGQVADVADQLAAIPAALRQLLAGADAIREVARHLGDARAVLFLGRQVGFPVALEGALKLKELAYLHAEGFAAGELKHGPIALIEDGMPVVTIMPSAGGSPVLHSKMMSNIAEVQSRGAQVVALAETGDQVAAATADHVIELPVVLPLLQPLVATVPLQILAAEMAGARGFDIDKPRNLAKSVTVE